MKRISAAVFLFILSVSLSAQSNPRAYRLYNERGRKTSYRKMMRDLKAADVILFGEYHNNPISHWLQVEVAKDLDRYDLGLEMFETDEQEALDSFYREQIDVDELDKRTGGVWPNFRTDYLPLIQQARRDSARVIATNSPRRYARMVFRRGLVVLMSLPESDKRYLPPLPVPYDPELPAYKAMVMPQATTGGHGGDNFPKAQAIKDATMGWFIAGATRPGVPFLHINGSYHSDDFEGINWYLRQYKPQLKVVTITTLEQEDISELPEESVGKADYSVVVPATMTKTY